MRGLHRRSAQHEEEESAFVSMTDMTVSFLFIMMILLAFFATQYSSEDNVPRALLDTMRDQRDEARQERDDAISQIKILTLKLEEKQKELDAERVKLDAALARIKTLEIEIDDLKRQIEELKKRLEKLDKKDPLETYMSRAAAARLRILEGLRDRLRLDFPNLMIEISAESDALRFQGEGLFQTGRSNLGSEQRKVVQTIAQRLNEILPCYTLGSLSSWGDGCNPSFAIIEAVQIEGHTDSQGRAMNNLTLSTARANATFGAMIEVEEGLIKHQNYRKQPVLSVAGYGQMRPVAENESPEGRATNRRIDLRIIMHTPALSEDIDVIRKSLQAPSEVDRP